jgi:hypothetical protein
LRAHGVALCITDAEDVQTPPLQATAEWGYLRLRGVQYTEADPD